VAQPADYPDYAAPWGEMALNIGKAVGKPKAMQALVDEVSRALTAAPASTSMHAPGPRHG
jgi:hypothetical protein